MANRFRDAGHFETSASNGPKMTLNSTWSKVPRIHITITPELQISLFFTLWLVAFELQAILRQHKITPKMTSKTKRSKVLYKHTTGTPHETLHLALRRAVFKIQSILRDMCTFPFTPWPAIFELLAILRQLQQMTPTMTLNTKSSKVLHTHVTTTPESQISLCFILRPAVFGVWVILRQVHKMTTKWSWTLSRRPYVPHICYINANDSKISLRFALRLSIFELQAILRQVHWITLNTSR